MNTIADAIQQFFAGAADSLTPFLAALSVIGVATMALIQTVKDITPLRRKFQEASLDTWLHDGAAEANAGLTRALSALGIQGVDPSRARTQLVRLSVDGDERALFGLSIEQMCGQMNSALQVALDYPKRNLDLLLVAASNAEPDDIEALARPDDARLVEDEASRIRLADARNRVVNQLQRAIDGFQIRTSYRWKWWLQVASFVVSVVLAAVAVAQWPGELGMSKLIAIVMTALAAGFLAPVARDLTAVLQKFRG